jgi:hypothetical protein
MAQQITIDIVAETKKLTSGVNEVNSQLGTIDGKLKGVAAAATAAASAFVLKQGVSFLKDGIKEAQDAELAMKGATSAFGEGSAALKKITEDADKFGKSLGMDNDDIIKLATQLGTYLPESARGLSAELINVGADVAALTGVDVEAWTKKLAKGMADGELKASDLEKMFPKLSSATYAQAEAAFKAGKSQEALSLLIKNASSVYGDAAENQVTATQKFDVALANLKETIGTKILPMVNKFVDALTTLLDWFSKQPSALQNIELGLLAIVGIGVPFLGFLASAKTSLAALGLVTGEYTIAQRLANFTLMGFPGLWVIAAIVAVIAIIVVLVKNWDSITEVVGKVWEAIKNFAVNAWNAIKEFGSNIAGFVSGIISKFNAIPGAMLAIGKNIASGLWDGIASMAGWLKTKIGDFFGNLLPGWAKKILGIASPSKVFAGFGEQIVAGLAQGIDQAQNLAKQATFDLGNTAISGFRPQLAGVSNSQAPINITINAGLGTDPYILGREVNNALLRYGKVSSRVK